MKVQDLPTPALVVDAPGFEHNLATMAAALPGPRCRPHVKAHKTTALARRQAAIGHTAFCAATPREIIGMAAFPLDGTSSVSFEAIGDAASSKASECRSPGAPPAQGLSAEVTYAIAVPGGDHA
ncbi:MAG: alanine racemase, partial [Acidimicrobiia bacterium]